MQIVIDIDEDVFTRLFDNGIEDYAIVNDDLLAIAKSIRKGIPLPKGHGRLGDLDKIKKEMQNYYDDCAKTSGYTRLGFETAIAVVEDVPTIIEADIGNAV